MKWRTNFCKKINENFFLFFMDTQIFSYVTFSDTWMYMYFHKLYNMNIQKSNSG